MSEIYIYPADCTDFTTIGLCGCLFAASCTFEEVANGMSEITLVHPLDRLGKYKYIENDRIISVEVPVRTTPEIVSGASVTSVTKYTVKTSATKAQRYIFSAAENGSKRCLLNTGEEVTVTEKPATGSRWKCKSGRYSGWIESAALDESTSRQETIPSGASGIEKAAPAWRKRLQLFRIYNVDWSSEGEVTAKARHITYDLMYDLSSYENTGSYTLQAALNGILTTCVTQVPFAAYTDIGGTQVGALYKDNDPITALLDPENGLCKRWGAQLIRDNNELFLLANAGMNRGVVLEYAKNLKGVTMTADQSLICTKLRPIGTNKDGTKLYLDPAVYPDGCISSELIDNYPIQRVLTLEVGEAKVSGDMTVAEARAVMVSSAQAEFAGGCDKPKISVSVDFALLGDTQRYSQYKNLDNVYLFDTVGVYYPDLGVNIDVDVVRVVWDCLRDRMQAVELGELQALTSSVSSWQISGGVSGSKLIQGTVGAGQLSADAISTRHLQAGSINADKIQAGAITAEKISASDLYATGATIDELQAAFAQIVAAHVEKLNAGTITADRLKTALGEFEVLTAGSATFDRETVRHLIASLLHVEDAVGERVSISNLAVDYASIVTATVGNLIIKASDGKYYRLDVTDSGVTPVQTTVTDDEIDAGTTETGKTIVETQLTVSELSATGIKAVRAIINELDAARIDVDKLTARSAFVDWLRTANIVSNTGIRLALDDLDDKMAESESELGEIKRYMDFTSTGLTQRVPGHIYYTLINETGFDVRSERKVEAIATMNADEGVKCERLTLGGVTCKATTTGGWVWQ